METGYRGVLVHRGRRACRSERADGRVCEFARVANERAREARERAARLAAVGHPRRAHVEVVVQIVAEERDRVRLVRKHVRERGHRLVLVHARAEREAERRVHRGGGRQRHEEYAYRHWNTVC